MENEIYWPAKIAISKRFAGHLSWIPRTYVEKLSCLAHACDFSTGEIGTGNSLGLLAG